MAYDFGHLKKSTTDNAPGLKKRVLVAPRRLFTTLAEPSAAGVTPGDKILISADHTFAVGDGWIELYTTLATAELIAESVGERDSRTTNPSLTCFHPGSYAAALEFAEEGKNEDWIVLVEGLNGEFIQIGEDTLEAEMSYAFNSGKVDGGQKGITFTFSSYGKLYVYEGAITLKP